jgi:Tfp pilus assembly protein PilN
VEGRLRSAELQSAERDPDFDRFVYSIQWNSPPRSIEMNADTLLQKARQYPLVVAFSGCAMLAIVVLGLRFSRIEELEEQAARLDEQLATMQRNARYAGTLEEDSAELKALLARIQEHLASPSPNAKASNLDYFYGLESAPTASA